LTVQRKRIKGRDKRKMEGKRVNCMQTREEAGAKPVKKKQI
jgi:hypothetical protein